MRRFQIGFVWRLFRFPVLLSGNVRMRLCHRLAAVACYAATQAHPVIVIRPASAIWPPPSAIRHPPSAICHLPPATRHSPLATRHSPLATRHSSGGTRWTRVVEFPGLPVLFRAPAFMTATQVHLAQANHHGALATCHPLYGTPSSATRNRVHFACMTPYEMLRFPGFLKISAGLVFVASQSSATTCIHVSLDSGGQRS